MSTRLHDSPELRTRVVRVHYEQVARCTARTGHGSQCSRSGTEWRRVPVEQVPWPTDAESGWFARVPLCAQHDRHWQEDDDA